MKDAFVTFDKEGDVHSFVYVLDGEVHFYCVESEITHIYSLEEFNAICAFIDSQHCLEPETERFWELTQEEWDSLGEEYTLCAVDESGRRWVSKECPLYPHDAVGMWLGMREPIHVGDVELGEVDWKTTLHFRPKQ